MTTNERSAIYLAVARTAKERGYYDLSAEYYELYTKEEEHENRTAFSLENINIAGTANRNHPTEMIPAIKEIRQRADLGLKEAKDLLEAVRGEYR